MTLFVLDYTLKYVITISLYKNWCTYLGHSVFQCIVAYICTHSYPLCLYTSLRSYKVWTHTRLHLK